MKVELTSFHKHKIEYITKSFYEIILNGLFIKFMGQILLNLKEQREIIIRLKYPMIDPTVPLLNDLPKRTNHRPKSIFSKRKIDTLNSC